MDSFTKKEEIFASRAKIKEVEDERFARLTLNPYAVFPAPRRSVWAPLSFLRAAWMPP